MDRWTAKAALIVVFGMVVSAVALLPSVQGQAEQGPAQYRQFVPLVAGDSATGPTPGSQGSPAAGLASELTAANSDAARVATLEKLSKALGIGVYAADGTPIVTGAEQSSQDFYYYEPEIVTMAASLGRGERWSFDDIAAFLNGPGLLANGATVTAVQVQAGVAKAISEAEANASATASFEPVFVHQLGLKHTPADDLADISTATSARVLDAAQRAVILDDFLISLKPASTQVAASSALTTAANGVLTQSRVTAQGTCGDFKGTEAVRNLGKFAAGFVEIAGKVIQVATLPIDAFHGASLAYGVKVEALADNLHTHYGHESAGVPLDFPIRVTMLDDLPQAEIDCGWMIGITFPKKGPIPNVKVEWDSGTLESHGKVVCEQICQLTGSDGVATLHFEPKQEQAPYTGVLTSETGRVEANALYLTSLGNMFGAVDEVVTPKTADFVWNVEWHEKGSWEGQVTTTWSADGEVASGTTNVRFEVGLAAPGEGDTHTNVYKLAEGTTTWTQSLDTCLPATKTGTTAQPAGSAALTVTEKDGTMTYEFASFGSVNLAPYTVVCGDDDPISVDVFSFAAGFPFPLGGEDNPRFTGPPQPVGNTITGSTTLVLDDGTVSWTWKLTKK
jgi:hypothetical protein